MTGMSKKISTSLVVSKLCEKKNTILLILRVAPYGAAYIECVAPFYAKMRVWRRARLLPRPWSACKYGYNFGCDILFSVIRHIAITICPFRFAFSHLPRCGKLFRQKYSNNFTWNFVQVFLRFFDSSKPSQSVSLIYKFAWLAGFRKSKENLLKTSWKVVSVIKVAHIFWWRHDNWKQSTSAPEHWCDVSCDIPYCNELPYKWKFSRVSNFAILWSKVVSLFSRV